MTTSIAERFWAKVDRTGGSDACWPFLGARCSGGYGMLAVSARKRERSHRLAWSLTNGDIPAGQLVRHDCDNRPCCNPSHLRLGTDADNQRDMWSRGRGALEHMLPHTKLSDQDVRDIRAAVAAGARQRDLLKRYPISAGHMSSIVTGRFRHRVEPASPSQGVQR